MDKTERRSMDDVLASIRRIVRTERQAEDSEVIVPVDERRGNGSGPEEPLVLTPEMRMEALAAEAGTRPSDLSGRMAGAAAGEPGAVPDRAELKAMLREILRDELDGGPAEQAVRDIIREELVHGEIGRNISENVLRLIRSEVAKAPGER